MESLGCNCDVKLQNLVNFQKFNNQLFFRLIFASAIIVCILSTIYDIKIQKLSQTPRKIYIAFSLYTNGQKLFDTTVQKNSFNSFNGIRSIAALSIMFCHRYSFDFNKYDYIRVGTFLHNVIFWSRMSVDTFFVIGAFLQTISILKAIDEETLNIQKVILKRYLRYTPTVLGSVLFHILLPHFINGPFLDDEIITRREIYAKDWPTFVLHTSNIFELSQW